MPYLLCGQGDSILTMMSEYFIDRFRVSFVTNPNPQIINFRNVRKRRKCGPRGEGAAEEAEAHGQVDFDFVLTGVEGVGAGVGVGVHGGLAGPENSRSE